MDTNAAKSITPPIPSGKELPKKYIRTLESDMATLKKGGVPDLTPLKEAPPLIVAPPPKAVEPVVKPPREPASEPIINRRPEITLPTTPIPTFSQIIKTSPPPPPPPPKPEPPPVVPPPVKPTPIKTYANDFADRMKDTHASTATILAAEQDSLEGAPRPTPPQPSRGNLPYLIAGTLLLIVGVASAYAAYAYHIKISAPVLFTPNASAPIFVDDREQISGVGSTLLLAIEESASRPLASGTVRLLYTASSSDTRSVFSSLAVPAPDILLRNVQALGSMAGIVNVTGNQSPFFILSTLSYGDTYAGMLSWEPQIRRDLGALFPPYPTATSTPLAATKMAPAPTAFVDEVVDNHDARIYRDLAGRSVLIYGYWNQSTLVIARDPSAFAEILQRLATSRAQQ
ncbi:MAG: hypothetical protein ACYC6X_01700 [Minisyncoccota bacterium]